MPQYARPDGELMQMISGYMPAFLIRAAIRLDLPAVVGDQPMSTDEIAGAIAAHPPSLRRVLRGLAALGVLAEDAPDAFRITHRGTLLRPDVPGSVYAHAVVMLDDAMWDAWPALDLAVRSGRTAFEHVHDADYMTHTRFADVRSDLRIQIDRSMLDETRPVAGIVVDAYDMARFSTVVDIGGGSGPLIAAVLAAHPHLRGTVLDRADGLRWAPDVLAAAGVDDRCEVRVGDFFSSIPAGDLHLCKSVIFNWPDDHDVSTLLANSRRALADSGRLLMVEQMLPDTVDGSMPADVYVSDVNSVASLSGRLRTESEYRSLLTGAGFELVVHRLPNAPDGYSLLEAVPR